MRHNPAASPHLLYPLLLLLFPAALFAGEPAAAAVPYGDNQAAGKYAEINGIRMYYEVYGEGEPLVLIHGSGQSVAAMQHQIGHFAADYRVIVADSRAHGKSDLGEGRLTYEQMAADWAALLEQLDAEQAKIVGWSDGGIISLLLAIHHPQRVGKIAIMGANLRPDASAVYPWAVEWVAEHRVEIDRKLAAGDKSENWQVQKQLFGLLGDQPDISLEQLRGIDIPVLVMAGDRDIIREEHTVLMFQTLPKSHLAIFPGETHFTPETDPALFNATVGKFMNTPFTRPESRDIVLGEH